MRDRQRQIKLLPPSMTNDLGRNISRAPARIALEISHENRVSVVGRDSAAFDAWPFIHAVLVDHKQLVAPDSDRFMAKREKSADAMISIHDDECRRMPTPTQFTDLNVGIEVGPVAVFPNHPQGLLLPEKLLIDAVSKNAGFGKVRDDIRDILGIIEPSKAGRQTVFRYIPPWISPQRAVFPEIDPESFRHSSRAVVEEEIDETPARFEE